MTSDLVERDFTFVTLQQLTKFCKEKHEATSSRMQSRVRRDLTSYSYTQMTKWRILSRLQMKRQLIEVIDLIWKRYCDDRNIKDQTLSISGYLTLEWLDSRLAWSNTSATSQDYSNVRFLFSTEEYVWRPAIIIENSVIDISVISNKAIPMRIASAGRISWSPSGIYVVSCESDTTYYPMDYQTCTIKVSTWAYTQSEITLLYDHSTPVETGFYSENGEWDLLQAVGTKTEEKARGGQTFSSLTFQINLQRRPMFHVLNTMFPVALMAILIPMVFKLPPDSGEKIGYALTVLLAYAVYLTLISENIPSTSVTICYLSIYLALTLMYGTLSVIFVILVLMVNHKPEEDEIPNWLRQFITKILMRVTCWNCKIKCCSRGNKDTVEPIPKDTVVKVNFIEKPNLLDENPSDSSEAEEDEELTWKKISLIMDKFFFFITMTLVLITTLVVFAIMIVYYAVDVTS